jgi:hypothetical protein
LNSDTDGPTIIFYTALINTIQINHSQHTLAMWWNLKFFRPEPLPNLPAGRQVEKSKMKIRTKSYIEKLLPEPQLNSEPMLMCIASGPILQNPLLVAGLILILVPSLSLQMGHILIETLCY